MSDYDEEEIEEEAGTNLGVSVYSSLISQCPRLINERNVGIRRRTQRRKREAWFRQGQIAERRYIRRLLPAWQAKWPRHIQVSGVSIENNNKQITRFFVAQIQE